MTRFSPVFIAAFALAVFAAGCGTTPEANSNRQSAPANQAVANDNVNDQTNVNSDPGPITNESIEVRGTVFIKGYDTPSESYGIISTANQEIGLGKYDSMKEQFRPYVGDQVTVVFSNVCRSSSTNCCRTIFPFCGTVASWQPVE